MPLIALPPDIAAAPELSGDRIGSDVAAAILGLTRQETTDACRKKLIPHWRIGRRLRFSRRQLEAFIAEQGTAATHGARAA